LLSKAAYLNPTLFVRAVGALAVVCVLGIYGLRCTPDPPIRSDGAGYYAYLPALVVDHDLSMHGIAARGPVDPSRIEVYEETGAYLDKYPMGVATMITPFFLTAHGLSVALGTRADGYAPIYQAFAALAGVVYGWLGVVLLRRLLEQRFDARITTWTLAGVLFGTNVFHYFTWEPLYSHAYSFFLFAALLEAIPRWHAHPTIGRSLLIGAVAGFILLVRPTNGCALVLVPLYGLNDGVRAWFRRFPYMVLTGGVAAAIFTLQLFYWHRVTNHWFVYAYQGERFDPFAPKPLHVLLSFKKGVFVWAPVLALSVLGLWRARRDRLRPEFTAIAVILLLQLWIVSSWWCWWYGVSLGHRAFTEFVPFFALGLAAFLERGLAGTPDAANRTRRLYRCLVGYGVLMMALYWIGVLPFDGPNWKPLL